MKTLPALKSLGNAVTAVLLFSGARVDDAGMYWISNSFEYVLAVISIFIFLIVLLAALIRLHGFCSEQYDWDIFGLRHLNDLANGMEPNGMSDRIATWTVSRGRTWISIVGSCTVVLPLLPFFCEKDQGGKKVCHTSFSEVFFPR